MSRYPTPLTVHDGPVQGEDTGTAWWSQRFVDVLESFALGSRLTRGRQYARSGQVLTVEIASGTVTASVQGRRARPYQVSIGLTPFPELVWAKVEVALAEQAIHSARLLAGEMPTDLEDVFTAAGAPLFPGGFSELEVDCSCPDWEVPCKHAAATLYLLAETFDADPFQILAWRGRTRATLLDRLRVLRAESPVQPDGTHQAPPAPRPTGSAVALADLVDPPTEASRFWFAPVPLPARPTTLDGGPGLLLRQLPTPGPALGGARLVDVLMPAYESFAHR